MSAEGAERAGLHVVTPLLRSTPFSRHLGVPVYLKMENAQPAGSFKIRGIGNACQEAVLGGCSYLVGSSGGNAGMALAHAARELQMPVTIYIPETVPQMMVTRLQEEGAHVVVHGQNWNAANEEAEKLGAKPGHKLIHPFNTPEVWRGHSSLVLELQAQLPVGVIPSCIVVSVGGGGLICGIIEGMQKVGWQKVPVVAMETKGADSFNASVKAGKLVTLPSITSVAMTLGARSVTPRLLECLQEHRIISEVVNDKEAVNACLKFADDHRTLVEPSCGATLAALYSGTLCRLQEENQLQLEGPVVMIVCGGNAVTIDILQKWKKQFNL